MDKRVIFSVTNHHSGNCGRPPHIDDSQSQHYLSYFENSRGEQAIFVYDRSSSEGRLYMGEACWELPSPVRAGVAEGLVLLEEESEWLRVCWWAATAYQGTAPWPERAVVTESGIRETHRVG